MNTFSSTHRSKLGSAFALLVVVVLLIAFRKPLTSWFFPQSEPSSAGSAAHVHAPAPSGAREQPAVEQKLPSVKLNDGALAALETAYAAYEEIRAALAADTLADVPAAAARLEAALKAAGEQTKSSKELEKTLRDGAAAAARVGTEKQIEAARDAFGELSRALVLAASADERLMEGLHVFSCPMTRGYDKWLQPTERLENPYMGKKMLQCGSEAAFPGDATADTQAAAASAGPDEIAHYTCPMHPSVRQAAPGRCPICNMDLVPVTKREIETGVIIVDAERRQKIGVKIGKVEKRELDKTIRSVGKITYDETRIADVTLKFSGFIGQLFADATGKRVKKGHALFTVYSPEIYQAQQDLLIASAGNAGSPLLDASKRRLQLLDVGSGTIARVLESKKPMRYVPIRSPASGFIVEKRVFEGSAFEAGTLLMRIANLDEIWVEAELYEAELPLVKLGQPAIVTLPYLPGKRIEGKVTFIHPFLSGRTRTGKVRIEIDNQNVELKPDMYANVQLEITRGERLVVPESAVIYAGPRRLVFVDMGEGKLRPQEIQVGIKTGDYFEVLSGLKAGDRVVTSGNFLIAAESRLKSATEHW